MVLERNVGLLLICTMRFNFFIFSSSLAQECLCTAFIPSRIFCRIFNDTICSERNSDQFNPRFIFLRYLKTSLIIGGYNWRMVILCHNYASQPITGEQLPLRLLNAVMLKPARQEFTFHVDGHLNKFKNQNAHK